MDTTLKPGKIHLCIAQSNSRYPLKDKALGSQGQGFRDLVNYQSDLQHVDFGTAGYVRHHFSPSESLKFLTSPADFHLPPYENAARAEAQETTAPYAVHGPDRLRCQMCGQVFQRRQDLSAHRRSEHPAPGAGGSGGRYECSFCGVTFAQRGHLSKHRLTHTGERPYACHICQRRFTQKTHMVEHIRIHTGERPYRCEECQATFTQKTHLVGHLRTHTGERPFKCSECGKAFSTSSSLSRHRFVAHSNQRAEEEPK
ncbi:zinc finger protein 83 [Rhipicephalus sanguineus]|uniref:zinc finger protein 83 n=1 Tax=Rhipicephalus sanguineus TaxID=34632 RepID=UPI001895BA42|nr:zinc finger protein 83 [Rhipicephalus sanguineus]